MVNPVVLGSGNPLFKGMKEKLDLELVDTRTFGNGNILLTYRPAKGKRA
jgi:dihydrofolate reductase